MAGAQRAVHVARDAELELESVPAHDELADVVTTSCVGKATGDGARSVRAAWAGARAIGGRARTRILVNLRRLDGAWVAERGGQQQHRCHDVASHAKPEHERRQPPREVWAHEEEEGDRRRGQHQHERAVDCPFGPLPRSLRAAGDGLARLAHPAKRETERRLAVARPHLELFPLLNQHAPPFARRSNGGCHPSFREQVVSQLPSSELRARPRPCRQVSLVAAGHRADYNTTQADE